MSLKNMIKKIEQRLEQREYKESECLPLGVELVAHAFDSEGRLVFNERGELCVMRYFTYVDGVREYPTEQMRYYMETAEGRAEYARIEAKAGALHKERLELLGAGVEYKPGEHGPAIGEVVGVWGKRPN